MIDSDSISPNGQAVPSLPIDGNEFVPAIPPLPPNAMSVPKDVSPPLFPALLAVVAALPPCPITTFISSPLMNGMFS